MAVLEIVLAVILTLLGFAILAILLTRWTRRKQNEIDISRYSSEQSAGLLDYEDDRGFWNLYSTESDISYDNREGYNRNYTPSTSSLAPSQPNIVLPQESVSDTNDLKATPELLPGTVGPIMQFTAPIPGATGPIKLSQKTIVQTPGPIVQYTGPSACPPSMLRGLPLAPIMISQRTSRIAQVLTMDSSGKVTLSPMVIFPGYMDGELIKKSDSKAQILKSGSTTKFQSSREENKEELQKKISFTDSDEVVIAEHKRELSNFQDAELQKGKIEMEVKVKDSNAGIPIGQGSQVKKSETRILKGQGSQVKKNETRIPIGQGSQVKKNETRIPIGQGSQVKKNETRILKGQGSQVKKSETRIPIGQGSQVKKSETRIPIGQGSQVKKNETRIPIGQGSQVKKNETRIPIGQGSQVKKSETRIPIGQGSQVKKNETRIPIGQGSQVKKSETRIPIGQGSQVEKSETRISNGQTAQEKESSEDKEKEDNEKRDTGKDKEENDAKNKNVHGEKDKVQGKNNLTIKDKKVETSQRAKPSKVVKYNKKEEQ
uniref:Testis expressed basic protein 1 n=1 Tax=Bos taurus TaxID=9913 RepID=A0AAA9TUV4_BOVIN